MQSDLINAYRHRRGRLWQQWANYKSSVWPISSLMDPGRLAGHAADTLSLARADVRNGVRRWGPPDSPSLSRQADGRIYVSDPSAFGFRLVGEVTAETPRGRLWNRGDKSGWYTDPDGQSSRDGSGLCWGVVYQLPARNGSVQCVPGYVMGEFDGGPVLDLTTIYDGPADGGPITDLDSARDCARAADSMAQCAAETEREYQSAYQAGSRWADMGGELANVRRLILETLTDRRTVREQLNGAGLVPSPSWSSLCRLTRARVGELLEVRAKIQTERAALARGDLDPVFYPSADMKSAFCDGAGLDRFPG